MGRIQRCVGGERAAVIHHRLAQCQQLGVREGVWAGGGGFSGLCKHVGTDRDERTDRCVSLPRFDRRHRPGSTC